MAAINCDDLYVEGMFDCTTAATVYFQAGDGVYWDASANTAIRTPGDDSDFFLGMCVLEKEGSGTVVRVALNLEGPQGIGEGDIVLFEDFLWTDAIGTEGVMQTTGLWEVVDVGDATEVPSSDVHGGIFALTIAATEEAEDAVLFHDDQLLFDIDLLKTFECRLAVTTPGTGVTVVWGMAVAHNLDKDTVAGNTWFRLDANLALDVETDDESTDDDDNTTALTLTTGTYYTFKIDMSDKAAVKFFVNGKQYPDASTTYVMSNLTTEMQPYFSLDKASGAGTGALSIDWVRIVSARE
jgi:hypothetical protein